MSSLKSAKRPRAERHLWSLKYDDDLNKSPQLQPFHIHPDQKSLQTARQSISIMDSVEIIRKQGQFPRLIFPLTAFYFRTTATSALLMKWIIM